MKADLSWIAEVLKSAGYRGPIPSSGCVNKVSIDTRMDCTDALFVALCGTKTDGHKYVREAFDKGAAAAIVSRAKRAQLDDADREAPIFDVKDTLEALQILAAAWREKVNPKVIAVTGSCGKTATKELLSSILSIRFSVHATPGNLNNHIGLPLTLLGMERDAEICVAEMGANHRGEIEKLCDIAKPLIGIVTNVGPAHLEHFGSLKGVAAAKSELLRCLPREGTALIPADDEFADYLVEKICARKISVGFSDRADRRITGLERIFPVGYRFALGEMVIEVRRHGKHNVMNAALAAAAGSIFGVTDREIAEAVASFRALPGRGAMYDVAGIVFVDESYNSNPASLKAAIDSFSEIENDGRRWFVLGDMLELGDASAQLHREAGVYCGRARADGILTIGRESVELSRAAAEQRKSPEHITHFLDLESLASHLDGLLSPGDLVLVKGSRAMSMEKVIEAIERARHARRRRID